MRKKYFVVFAICVCVLSTILSGCEFFQQTSSFSYGFRQERNNVKQIEICTYQDGWPLGTITPFIHLTNEQITAFWKDIQNLECKETKKFDTPSGYGDIIFLVTYQDGEKEIISLMWIGHIAADGSHTETLQYFDPIELSKVFAKYGDPALMAEKSEDFRHYWNMAIED